MDVKEKLEDTKEVIRCRKWTKDRQYNDKRNTKGQTILKHYTNVCLRNTTEDVKYRNNMQKFWCTKFRRFRFLESKDIFF